MIRQIRGTVLEVLPMGAVIEVSGWGVFVAIPSSEGLVVGDTATLKTHLAVKQDGLELYGFTSTADLRFFELVLKVPGVGPKTAIALLRKAPRVSIEEAIARKDLPYLTKVAGLGKKSAEKLIIEIAEKVGAGTGETAGEDGQVFDTLVALGYTEREARDAVHAIPRDIQGQDARLKAALSRGAQ